jgi:hypothetical protein
VQDRFLSEAVDITWSLWLWVDRRSAHGPKSLVIVVHLLQQVLLMRRHLHARTAILAWCLYLHGIAAAWLSDRVVQLARSPFHLGESEATT